MGLREAQPPPDIHVRSRSLALNVKTAARSHQSDRRFRLDPLPRALAGAPSGISQMLRTAEYDAGEPDGQAAAHRRVRPGADRFQNSAVRAQAVEVAHARRR